jgi:hypothetical protein
MHRHTVLFNLKDDADEEAVIESMRVLASLPTVDAMVLEENALPPGDKSPYKWCLIGDFADQDARDAYEKHDTHVDVIRNTFLPAVKDFIISDINT